MCAGCGWGLHVMLPRSGAASIAASLTPKPTLTCSSCCCCCPASFVITHLQGSKGSEDCVAALSALFHVLLLMTKVCVTEGFSFAKGLTA